MGKEKAKIDVIEKDHFSGTSYVEFRRVQHVRFMVAEGKNLLSREVKTSYSYLAPFQDKK